VCLYLKYELDLLERNLTYARLSLEGGMLPVASDMLNIVSRRGEKAPCMSISCVNDEQSL